MAFQASNLDAGVDFRRMAGTDYVRLDGDVLGNCITSMAATMNLRDDIELTALAETGRLDIAEDIGLIVQYCWDMLSIVTGIDMSIIDNAIGDFDNG